MKLTVKSVAQLELPAGKTDFTFFDDDLAGFGLRLREGGSRTWIYRYRASRSKQRSMALGNAKSMSLVVARETASGLEAKVRLGGDPARDKQTARAATDNLTSALIDQYLDRHATEWRPSTAREVKRHLLTYARPLHGQPITAVEQSDISRLLNEVAKSSGAVSANRLRATLSAFFSWTIKQGIRLPAGNVASLTEVRKEQSRDRVLSDAEIRTIWRACTDDDHGAIIKLLLLTGCRANEIGGLRWDEVRDDHIILPGTRTKNDRSHVIPLSAPAKAILDSYRLLGRDFAFGRGDGGLIGWGKCKKRLDKRIAETNGAIKPWVVHDLRRTCATGMIDLGIQPHIVEAVLNHVSGHRSGVAGIYNRATYDKEKREALALWANHILALVEG